MDTTYYGAEEAMEGLAVLGVISGIFSLVMLVVGILAIVSLWKIFTKAGKEGWKSLIPFYNFYIMFEIVGMSGWMFLLLCVPLVNFVMIILLYVKLAQAFGKSGGFAVGLILLSPVFLPLLAFGKSTYCLNGNNDSGTIPVTNTTNNDGGVVSPVSNMDQPTMVSVENNPVTSMEQPMMSSVENVPVMDQAVMTNVNAPVMEQPVMTSVEEPVITSVVSDPTVTVDNNVPPQQ